MATTLVRRLLGSPVLAALAAPHGVDRYLELVNPRWSLHEVRAEVLAAHRGTADSVTLTLRPNGNWRGFRAGQYARFGVEIDGVRRTRCFSLASSQHRADRVEITVKAHPGGTVSRHLLSHARPGLVLAMSQAEGDFVLPTPRPSRLLLVTGGSGITPAMAMLRTLADEGHRGRVTLLHYARSEHDVIHRDELARLTGAYVVISHTGHPSHTGHTGHTGQRQAGQGHVGEGRLAGRFRAEHLAAADPEHAAAVTYLCGPAPLMDAVRTHYAAAGLDHRLHVERFTLARFAPDPDDATGQVRFTAAGRTVTNDGSTLLVQAERAGLTPEHGCRMGVCLTCSRRAHTGTVRDLRTGAVTPVDETDIQLCVSTPVGDVSVDL